MATMNGVDKVSVILANKIDSTNAMLSFELIEKDKDNEVIIKEKRSLHLSPLFFTTERGERISPKELRNKCVDIALDLGYNRVYLL
jgi:hypothetical protein